MARFQQIDVLFSKALELPDNERAAFVRAASNGDGHVFREVISLLEAHEDKENVLEANILNLSEKMPALTALPEGRCFGNYKIIREIGSGGMGAVYLAERTDGEFAQTVALKIVRQTIVQSDLEDRFRQERQILASLNHPNIAKLLDGGISDLGEPYFVMEFVEGKPILEFADDHRLSIKARLSLFLKVCSAVSFAHRELVIHRDIKPLNLLVTRDGEPMLLDFGLAKILNEAGEEATNTLLRAFTPGYASPEQVLGRHITTASDIYSLGVVLYELLTGAKPLELENLSLEEMVQTIRTSEPTPPSRVSVSGVSGGRTKNYGEDSEVAARNALKGDLDTIVLKALSKEPAARYQSVEQFAGDIERFLKFEPILARPQTLAYSAAKFVRRNLLPVAAAALVLISLSTGLGVALWQGYSARVERDRAQTQSEKAARINTFFNRLMLTANPAWNATGFGREREVTLIEVIDEAARTATTEFADQPDILAELQHNIGTNYISRGRYEAAETNLRSSLEISKDLFGTDHPDTVQRMRDLAAVRMLLGDYDGSELQYKEALGVYRLQIADGRTGGNTILGFAGSLNDLGFLYRLKGEPDLAESVLTEALSTADTFSGNHRAVTAIVLGHLGMANDDRGDSQTAESYLQRSLTEFRELAAGGKRAESAGSFANMGIVLQGRGDLAAAETFYVEALATYRQLLGESHPNTAFGISRLADLHLEKGDLGTAESMARDSLERARRALPSKHPNLAYPLTVLGLALCRDQRISEGEKYAREALELRMRAMNPGHWRVAESEGALGECLLLQQRYSEAEPLLKKSLTSLSQTHSPESFRVSFARNRLEKLNSRVTSGKGRRKTE